MKKQRFRPDDPQEWLNRAKSNLARALNRNKDIYLEDLCFDAQQAAEKSLKSVLIFLKTQFPYVHDLSKLLTLIECSKVKVPTSVKQAGRLTRYAVLSRYPGPIEPVTMKEYKTAIKIAKTVVGWAEKIVNL